MSTMPGMMMMVTRNPVPVLGASLVLSFLSRGGRLKRSWQKIKKRRCALSDRTYPVGDVQ
jgi:hypothetical protein